MKKSKWIKRVQINWQRYLNEKKNAEIALSLFQSESYKRKMVDAMVIQLSSNLATSNIKLADLTAQYEKLQKEFGDVYEKLNQSQKENCEFRRNLADNVLVPQDVLDTLFGGTGNPVLDRQGKGEEVPVTYFHPSGKAGDATPCKHCGEMKWNHDVGYVCRKKKIVGVYNPSDNFFQNHDGTPKGTKPEINNNLPVRVKVLDADPWDWYNINDEFDVADAKELNIANCWVVDEDLNGATNVPLRVIPKAHCRVIREPEVPREPLISGIWKLDPGMKDKKDSVN